jgi:hypothetical protein
MDDLSDDFKVKGALLECFLEYPQFRDDFEVLIAEGYVKVTGPETCKWTKSKASLAQYFKWVGHDARRVTGGLWSPVSRVFGETQVHLSKNASSNGNPRKRDAIDFVKIKAILEEPRKQQKRWNRKH